MKKYVIDGLFLTQKITGTQRYAYEIVNELDKIIEKDFVEILVPEYAENLPKYEHIIIVKYGKRKGIMWQQFDMGRYLLKEKKLGIFFNNVFPLLYAHGIITIHDVCYKANPQFYSSIRDKLSMLWHRLNYWAAIHSTMKILTVSEFSKSEIIKYYNADPDRITVIYNSWQHIDKINYSDDTFDKYPMLKADKYYFSMSTLGANKNFKWILYAAKNNPNETFAIAGGGKLKGASEAMGFTNLPNIHFLGYVSDEDAKTLMANCKAFLFPTLYEGFGIPPLEAVYCGCRKIIISDTPCMREIYGDFAEYINAYDYLYRFIDDNKKREFDLLLSKYSWKKSAEQLYKLL